VNASTTVVPTTTMKPTTKASVMIVAMARGAVTMVAATTVAMATKRGRTQRSDRRPCRRINCPEVLRCSTNVLTTGSTDETWICSTTASFRSARET